MYERGKESSREVIGDFEYRADAVVIASGGIGANLDLVKKNWPSRLGIPPERMVSGVPAYVDGSMLEIAEGVGGRLVNQGPDVALHRRAKKLESDMEKSRYSYFTRTVFDVV